MPPKRSRKRRASSPNRMSLPTLRKSHEIHEAFRLFCTTRDDAQQQAADEDDEGTTQELEDMVEDEHGIIRVLDVRRALKSLNLPPPPSDFFDEDQRFLSWDNFKELAKTMADLDQDEGGEGDATEVDRDVPNNAKGKGKGKAKETKPTRQEKERAEIDHAFALFTTPIPTSGKFQPDSKDDRKITLADLKRVTRELRENVDEKVLKMMLLEANGGEGDKGVLGGVGREEFEIVMKRAGVFA